MKKRIKRITSLMLTAALMLSLMPSFQLTASAALPSDSEHHAGQYIDVWMGTGATSTKVINGSTPTQEDPLYHDDYNAINYLKQLVDEARSNGNGYEGVYIEEEKDGKPIVSTSDDMRNWVDANQQAIWNYTDDPDDSITITIKVAENSYLRPLAAQGTAEFYFGGYANSRKQDLSNESDDHNFGHCKVSKNNSKIVEWTETSEDDNAATWGDTGWVTFDGDDIITISVWTHGAGSDNPTGVRDIQFYFRDTVSPVWNGYTFTTNGTFNNSDELLLKQYTTNNNDTLSGVSEYIDVNFNFSEPVISEYAAKLTGTDEAKHLDLTANHTMFYNPTTTGYARMGESVQLCQDSIYSDMNKWVEGQDMRSYASKLGYRYTTRRGDFSGNLPISDGGNWYGNDNCLINKLYQCSFHDAAGNPVTNLTSNGTSSDSDGSLGTTSNTNPFDYYDIIVDAEPPTYSKTMNSIYPDILTQLVLNDKDYFEFQVNFSESVQVKKYNSNRNETGWDYRKTYLHLNNGDKAYYLSGVNTDTWRFGYTVPAVRNGKSEETPLLRVLALANDSHTVTNCSPKNYSQELGDTFVITDYVGNPLTELCDRTADVYFDADNAGNKDAYKYDDGTIEPSGTDLSDYEHIGSLRTEIDWTLLSIDNTSPDIAFEYAPTPTGATRTRWGNTGSISFNATDPEIPIPTGDPSYNASYNNSLPSVGIFRPSNTTSESNESVGLMYYVWSQSSTQPATDLMIDEYWKVKRYSLSGVQPEGYEGNIEDCLLAANNISENIVPPPAALESAGSGVWYLHAFTSDMTWDSARQRIQYEKSSSVKFNTGYDETKYQDLLKQKIDAYRSNTSNYTGGSRPSYDTARSAVIAEVYNTVFTTEFIEWLNGSGSSQYSADAMNYANKKALLKVGDYGNSAVWTQADYSADDSNWSHAVTTIYLDNTKPVLSSITSENVSNNNTAIVDVAISANDAHSGIQTIKYQFASDPSLDPSGAAWVTAVTNTGDDNKQFSNTSECTATTLGSTVQDGTYTLWVQVTDGVGNVTQQKYENLVVVDSTSTVVTSFGIPTNTNTVSVKTIAAPTFSVGGLKTSGTNVLKYAVTKSAAKPTSGWNDMPTGTAGTAIEGTPTTMYTLPDIGGADKLGTYFLHISIVELQGNPNQRNYHYSVAYKLDNKAPVTAYNPSGAGYPVEVLDVNVLVTDDNPVASARYMAVKATTGAIVPTIDTTDGWTELTTAAISLIGEALLPEAGTEGTFLLYVLAEDEAGNKSVTPSSEYKLFHKAADPGIPDSVSTNLLAVSGDAQNGFYGVVKADLGIDMKEGYSYSVQTVRSGEVQEAWSSWQSYTNFITAKLPITSMSNRSGLEVWVKFRSPGGQISTDDQIQKIDISGEISSAPLYATAERDIRKKLPNPYSGGLLTGQVVTLMLSAPAGIQVTPSENNPDGLSGTGLTYQASSNACYAFDIVDLADPSRSDVLYVVVDNFDLEKPSAIATYSQIENTTENVTVSLSFSEPIRMLNNNGKTAYIYTTNGAFTFEFEDEAGNRNTYNTSVSNIVRTPPTLEVECVYSIGSGDDAVQFNTVMQGDEVKLAQGVILHATGDFSNVVAGGDIATRTLGNETEEQYMSDTKTMIHNGFASFSVSDSIGNMNYKSVEVDNIVTAMPDIQVSYDYINSAGEVVEPIIYKGEQYANADVRVTLSGTLPGADLGNKLHFGTLPVSQTRSVPDTDENGNPRFTSSGGIKIPLYKNVTLTNELPIQEGGTFTYTKTYTENGNTAVALCDSLANVSRVKLNISGIAKTAPELTVFEPVIAIGRYQSPFDWTSDLGGFEVSSTVFEPEDIVVTSNYETNLDLNTTGKYTVTYTATDPVGNQTQAVQTVYVMTETAVVVNGNDKFISAMRTDKALIPSNVIKFDISRYMLMKVGGELMLNEWATYDLYYVSGLYREGQLKTIAEKVTLAELTSKQYTITFPKPGWYTVIIRTQEREREYTTFFVSAMQK